MNKKEDVISTMRNSTSKDLFLQYTKKISELQNEANWKYEEISRLKKLEENETIILIQQNGLLSEAPLIFTQIRDNMVCLEGSADMLNKLSLFIQEDYHCYHDYEYGDTPINIHFSDWDIYVSFPADKYDFIIKEFGIQVSTENFDNKIKELNNTIAESQKSLLLLIDMKSKIKIHRI